MNVIMAKIYSGRARDSKRKQITGQTDVLKLIKQEEDCEYHAY